MHHRLGVPQDDAKAVYWWAKAAKQGNAMAQRNLGGMHLRGEGVPEDYVRAYAWSSISAAGGSARSKKGKKIIAKRMTPAQIAKAQKLSREYWEKYVVPFQRSASAERVGRRLH